MLFGNTRAKPRNLLEALVPGMAVGNADGIVATPEQEAESARMEQALGSQGVVPVDAAPRQLAPVTGMFARKAVGSKFSPAADLNPAPRRPSEIEAAAGRQDASAQPEDQPHWSVDGFDRLRSAIATQAPQAQQQGPLGGSMRQPFDYEAAIARLAGEKPKIKDWQKVLAVVADGLAGADGREGNTYGSLMSREKDYADRQRKALETVMGWQHGDWQNQNEADLRAANPFSSGRDRVQYDPATGQARVIYDGPEDFENYAQEMGLEPGTDEYFKAVEDFVLKGSGPSAYERDVSLDDHRTGNDASLERMRQGHRVGLEGLRQGNRQGMVEYRNNNPAPSRASSGSPRPTIVSVRTPEEARKLPPGTKFRTPDGKVKVRP